MPRSNGKWASRHFPWKIRESRWTQEGTILRTNPRSAEYMKVELGARISCICVFEFLCLFVYACLRVCAFVFLSVCVCLPAVCCAQARGHLSFVHIPSCFVQTLSAIGQWFPEACWNSDCTPAAGSSAAQSTFTRWQLRHYITFLQALPFWSTPDFHPSAYRFAQSTFWFIPINCSLCSGWLIPAPWTVLASATLYSNWCYAAGRSSCWALCFFPW